MAPLNLSNIGSVLTHLKGSSPTHKARVQFIQDLKSSRWLMIRTATVVPWEFVLSLHPQSALWILWYLVVVKPQIVQEYVVCREKLEPKLFPMMFEEPDAVSAILLAFYSVDLVSAERAIADLVDLW